METLFHKLFCKRKRRIQIMMLWHSRQPVEGKTVYEVLFGFLKTILYEELCITITPDKIYLFRNKPGLAIPVDRLRNDELQDLYRIYQKRNELFSLVQRFQTGGWKLTDYTKPTDGVLFTERYRREMIRDFVHFILAKKSYCRLYLITATQVLIEDEKKRDDVFLRNLHDKLQGIGNINNLLVIYD